MLGKHTVLVVDDDPDKLNLLQFALTRAGYEVRTASDGEEGLAAVASFQPYLVVSDIMMPSMNGYELARRIRQNPQTRFIPIILQTAAGSRVEDQRLGSEVGALGFITDPTDLELLLARARTYDFSADNLLVRSSNQLEPCSGPSLLLRLPLTPNSPAAAPVFNVNLLNSCYIYPDASLDGVEALRIDIARLARNFGLANHKNELKSHPAQTRFGELVVYQDRCEEGTELVRAVLPDPASSDARQTLAAPMARARGEHDLCVIFTGRIDGPLYAIETMKLMR